MDASDFESLSRILKTENDPSKFKRVERIVLYIDDLDRCPEKTVLEVLQAVHMLLAYDLFVVVVGVDPRWLMHSLKSNFGAFSALDEEDENDEAWKTTPQNYLEKIFQIPFYLRPMDGKGFQSLVGSIWQPDQSKRQTNQLPPTPVAEPETSIVANDKTALPQSGKHSSGEQSQIPNVDPATVQNLADFFGDDGTEQTLEEVAEQALRITEWEIKFASKLHPFLKTPRAVKRFTNIYRLLKASVHPRELQAFEGDFQNPGEFQVPMLLLAISTGSPEIADSLFPELRKWNFDWFKVVFPESRPPVSAFQDALLKAWQDVIYEPQFPKDREIPGTWLPRICRYSFTQGR